MNRQFSQLEANYFGAINRFVEPLIRAGLGNPVLWPTGTIVLETKGRITGRSYNVPLFATRIGDMLVVSTVRRWSQWLKNVAANPDTRYWLGGRSHEATAFVIAPGIERRPLDDIRPLANCLADALARQADFFGIGFAILLPHKKERR